MGIAAYTAILIVWGVVLRLNHGGRDCRAQKEAFFLFCAQHTNPNVHFSLANRYSWLNFELFTSSFGSLKSNWVLGHAAYK
jgi:hypothetical protein